MDKVQFSTESLPFALGRASAGCPRAPRRLLPAAAQIREGQGQGGRGANHHAHGQPSQVLRGASWGHQTIHRRFLQLAAVKLSCPCWVVLSLYHSTSSPFCTAKAISGPRVLCHCDCMYCGPFTRRHHNPGQGLSGIARARRILFVLRCLYEVYAGLLRLSWPLRPQLPGRRPLE